MATRTSSCLTIFVSARLVNSLRAAFTPAALTIVAREAMFEHKRVNAVSSGLSGHRILWLQSLAA